jgi:hypothetical protein
MMIEDSCSGKHPPAPFMVTYENHVHCPLARRAVLKIADMLPGGLGNVLSCVVSAHPKAIISSFVLVLRHLGAYPTRSTYI